MVPPRRNDRARHPAAFELACASALALVAAAVRAAYVVAQGAHGPYDPWRHRLLVDAVREGRGFTLFDGQPYLWYQPVWHVPVAWLPGDPRPVVVAAALSALSVAAFYLWARAPVWGLSRGPALAAAAAAALFGPWVAFTCHDGPEALALCALLAALALTAARPPDEPWRESPGRGITALALPFAGGLLYGLALLARMNLVFHAVLFLPALRRRRDLEAGAVGAALPLLVGWWRNRQILAAHEWVFAWDGLALRSESFGPLSMLIVQLHPDVASGLRRLHERIVPLPEWWSDGSTLQWSSAVLMLLCAAAFALSRRLPLALFGLGTLAYYLLLDATWSSHFFRIYVAWFPPALLAAAVACQRAFRGAEAARLRLWSAVAVLALLVGLGADRLRPGPVPRLEAVTPSPRLLEGADRFLAASGFHQPEALIARYPERRFLGLPLRPEEAGRFLADHPGYRDQLWHGFHVQEPLLDWMLREGGCRASGRERTPSGVAFVRMSCAEVEQFVRRPTRPR